MTSPIRILDTGLKPARWNVALTAALVERHANGSISDTLRFHRYPACVLLGRGRDLERSADLDFCRTHAIEIARRVTGGGAVFMSPRMLAWEIVIARNPLGSSFEPITQRICEGVAAGLSRFGAAACYRPPNDIEIGGLKVSGSGSYMEGRSAVLQGTVLIEDDVPAMARALRLGVGELRARVTCLSAALRAPPPIDDVKNRIIEALVQALDRTSVHAQPDPHDLALAEELLVTEIGTDEFTAGEREQLAGNSR